MAAAIRRGNRMKAKSDYRRVATGVYLRSGSYYAIVRGKTSKAFGTAEQAINHRANLIAEQTPKPAGGPFADFLRDIYYPHYTEKMRTNTQLVNKRIFESTIIPFFAEKKIQDIKTLDVFAFQKSMADRGLAPKTVNTAIGLLCAVFEAAIALEYVAINPTKKVKKLRETKKDRHVLTEVEIIDLVNRIEHPFKYLLALMGLAGTRVGEAMAFQWADFDLGDKPTISFNRTINIAGEEDELKTEGSEAQLPMVKALRDLLLEWQEECPDGKWLFQGEGLFRKSSREKSFHPPALATEWWWKQKARHGLDMRLYDFRHSFATNVVTRCKNIKTAQKLCRHANVNTTLEIYAHVRPEQLEEIWDW